MNFQKPTQKGITEGAVSAVAIVAGAKIGDGIAAIMPESTSAYKTWALAAAGIVAAACIKGTSSTDKALQNACIGIGVKQLYNGVTEVLTNAVDAKVPTSKDVASATFADKLQDGIVGHTPEVVAGSPYYALSAAWDAGTPSADMWDRPADAPAALAPSFI